VRGLDLPKKVKEAVVMKPGNIWDRMPPPVVKVVPKAVTKDASVVGEL
jgi:hypothetical protein